MKKGQAVLHTEAGNYFTEERAANQLAERQWCWFLEQGYVEVAPGILRHPQTGKEVRNG